MYCLYGERERAGFASFVVSVHVLLVRREVRSAHAHVVLPPPPSRLVVVYACLRLFVSTRAMPRRTSKIVVQSVTAAPLGPVFTRQY